MERQGRTHARTQVQRLTRASALPRTQDADVVSSSSFKVPFNFRADSPAAHLPALIHCAGFRRRQQMGNGWATLAAELARDAG